MYMICVCMFKLYIVLCNWSVSEAHKLIRTCILILMAGIPPGGKTKNTLRVCGVICWWCSMCLVECSFNGHFFLLHEFISGYCKVSSDGIYLHVHATLSGTLFTFT